MSNATRSAESTPALRWMLILSFAVLAFFASYRYAVAAGTTATTGGGAPVAAAGAGGCCGSGTGAGAGAVAGTGAGTAAVAGGGGCCGGGASGPQTTKAADVAGDVQKITVDLSKGYYDPSTVELKAGVPAEITFTQGAGCLAQVQSQDLNFFEDLTAGPKTVKLGALTAGTYSFTCGMQMVSGTIVVK